MEDYRTQKRLSSKIVPELSSCERQR